jgi:hypothetical protein
MRSMSHPRCGPPVMVSSGSVEKFGMTGCNCETGDEWVSPYEVIAFAAAR